MVPLEKMNLLDDFLFNATITDSTNGEKVARIILETILGRSLKDISVQGQRVFYGNTPQKHGIRLDALITEATGDVSGKVIYDLEPDKKDSDKEDFPRRGRYYHVLRDSKLLPSGVEYVRLPDSYVIFITPYDPLGTGRMLYSMQTMCAEDHDLPYDDGAYTLYLYTKGDPSTATPAISALLTFMEKSTPENAVNDDLKQLQSAIDLVKDDAEVKIAAMKYNKILLDERNEGLEEGLKEGLEKGEWKRLITQVCRKLIKGESIATIADLLEEKPETIQMIADLAAKHPDNMTDHIDEYVKEVLKIVHSPQNT